MINKFHKYFYTIYFLKFIQIYFRLYYYFRNNLFGNKFTFRKVKRNDVSINIFVDFLFSNKIIKDKSTFIILSIEKQFDSVDWNYSNNGKLWCYNLNYFDFLLQDDLSKDNGLTLINDYISKTETLKDGLEPYPISLRNINWIKFIVLHNIKDNKIDSFIFSCYVHLIKNLEYHLLGNHLLENAYSLFIGSVYFNDEKLFIKSKKLLKQELEEQILDDGAHFELSPMYHHILFERLLDCINFAKSSNAFKDHLFLDFLTQKAELMLGWLKEMKMNNGEMPLLNDSTTGIAKSGKELIKYAENLGVKSKTTNLGSCGYRKYINQDWELVADAGKPGPNYIPGHAHADIGNFILYYDNKPFIIDPGISTYDKNERRNLERSTEFHNTVVVNDQNQSDVWGGFRLGKRAKVKILKESANHLKLSHNGYKSICGDHIRELQFSETSITIQDILTRDNTKSSATAYFHLSKEIEIVDKGTAKISFNNGIKMKFKNAISIDIEKYNCPKGFNSYITCDKLAVHFNKSLETKIF
ncbi:alginate lyase family protein [Marivirga salinae]|uniref:Alginate lyase family protein n=1 Tax=Marivirga salinarum TaxID=3059078 RepID=A0AA49JGU8_9BACT|nr:alginate lyase family protein [Marivirga sp. BDSF4-3]WKK76262.2 alginate lyase family protein [Marivirga sp. BDSF4-3]